MSKSVLDVYWSEFLKDTVMLCRITLYSFSISKKIKTRVSCPTISEILWNFFPNKDEIYSLTTVMKEIPKTRSSSHDLREYFYSRLPSPPPELWSETTIISKSRQKWNFCQFINWSWKCRLVSSISVKNMSPKYTLNFNTLTSGRYFSPSYAPTFPRTIFKELFTDSINAH